MKLKKLISVALLLVLVLYSASCFATSATELDAANTTTTATTLQEINTYSPTALIMEAQTGKVIYSKNGYEKVYPASTTKIMTAILALEHCDLSETATASYESIYTVPWDYTNANIQVGEELTVNQLLNVLLIASANEAANILAEHVAGSVNSFTTMMNTKAEELGCKNTHFTNANGLQEDDHYTTAYDLALMGRYAMQNDTFRRIVSKTTYTLASTNKYSENDRVFANTNDLIHKNESDDVGNYYYEYCNGIKTGYTKAAGNCIVASAQKDGIEYIVVILGAGQTDNGLSARNLDCINLFNYAFDNYSVQKLHDSREVLKTITIKHASLSTRKLNALIQDEISVVVKNTTDLSNITPTVEIDSDLEAPIPANTKVGKITYTIDGNEYTSDLIAANDVKEFNFFSACVIVFALLIILIILRKLTKPKKKRKTKKKKTSNYKNKDYLYW